MVKIRFSQMRVALHHSVQVASVEVQNSEWLPLLGNAETIPYT